MEGLLPALVSLAIGIILFEGGLTLEPRDYLRSPVVIKRLLTLGALVTWLGSAAGVRFVFGASWEVSLLAGSLVIVTGPTVIIPLLKRLRLVPRVASILHWEGVMIDAIGVFLAVFCYELVVIQHPGTALFGFGARIAVGAVIGLGGGWLIQRALEKNWVPDNLINPFVLACAVGLFALAEWWIHESGLLAATLAGVWVARRRSTSVRQLRTFKAELSDLLIGTLFLLLVSRLDLRLFASEGPRLLLVVLVVMLVVRPLNILFSTIGAGLGWRERAFLGWVAPRGIVAASMASLFALQLSQNERFEEEAMLLEMFTYSVICGTVVVQGLSAGWMAKWLGLNRPPAKGWLI
ncbi:MAG TPA: cation:proton antiporter, partial [Opitutales bacterium]|nr:cation:proton antiporter [Opitutales bacterium]